MFAQLRAPVERFLIACALLLDIEFLVVGEITNMLIASTRIDVLNVLTDLKPAAILDLDTPWRVFHRMRPYLLNPREYYGCLGDVPDVAFPCAA